MEEKFYWLGFSVFPGIGPKKFHMLLERFGSAKDAWETSSRDLEKVLGTALADRLAIFKQNFSLFTYAEKIAAKNIQFLTLLDKEYPELLREDTKVHDTKPPFLLYVNGNLSLLNSENTIAVVGSRKITQYGREVTQMLTSQLVVHNFVIVSGLAFGVDAIAHQTTIKNNGKTIAVLGCGVDCCTPASNQTVYDGILDSGGTIVSTFPPGTQASRGSFPARNAIIAGLSLGILVTEGAEDSGALITASDAISLGRKVFAVPGPITSYVSKGANSLLQKGAIPVTGIRDILDVIPVGLKESKETNRKESSFGSFVSSDPFVPYTKEEQDIIDVLQLEPLHFDDIVRKIKKDEKEIGSLLSLMELKGMIKNNGGMYSL